VAGLLPAALLLEPVRTTFLYGQVNALLMALVVVDCLTPRPRWPCGALVGLAAAIKLTPGLFVLFFLVRGDRKAVLTTLVSFLCASGIGFLLDRRGSVKYWTESVFQTDRVGEPVRTANQSIMGLLARLGAESTVLWVLASATLLGATAMAMRRAFAAGQPAWALALCALGTLPIAPISWSHHWVWCVPILLYLGVAAWRSRNRLTVTLTGIGMLVFTLSPHWWFEKTDPWTADRMLLGNTYLLFAATVIVCGALGRRASSEFGELTTTSR
jgi:alpha-1,2-mannosyltransferase